MRSGIRALGNFGISGVSGVSGIWGIVGSRRALLRLNHIFIPEKKPDRDRVRKRLAWRLLAAPFALYIALSREGRALALFTIFVGFAGLDVRQSQVYFLFAILAGLLLASLLARPFFQAPRLGMHVDAPARVSVGESARFLIHLHNEGERRLLGLRVMGPFLPWDGKWTRFPDGVAAIEPGARATVFSEASFVARGEHHLDAFEVAPLVPLGLALGARRESEGVRFLVVPRIADLVSLELAHRLPLRAKGAVIAKAPGESEIIGVRPYRSGDPLRHLHARTWARTGTPHVRQYVAERADRVALLVWLDGAESSERAREAALEVAAGAASFLTLRGAGLDLLVVDEGVLRVEPRAGRSALDLVLDRLAVHGLSQKETLPEALLAAEIGALSTLVLVTADEGPRRHALVASLVQRGLPVRWLSVVEDSARAAQNHEAAGAPITRISVERIEAQHGELRA